MSVTVVLPTWNEAENLPALIPKLLTLLPGAEVLVVDDASSDGTADLAEALGARVLRRKGPRDLSLSVLDGLRAATHDLCVCMDADLSHPVEAVPTLVDAVQHGAAMAMGSRYASGGTITGWGPRRHLTSRLATAMARPLTPVTDPMSGMFALRRSAIDLGALRPIGYKIALEILVRSGVKPVEIPIAFVDRQQGHSKLRIGVQAAYVQHLWRLVRARRGPLERPKGCGKSTMQDCREEG